MVVSVRTGLLLLLPLTTTFCASKNPPPTFAFDHAASFTNLKTYAWFDEVRNAGPHGNSIVDGPFIDRTVRQAVDETLQGKGLQESKEGQAEIYVDYRFDEVEALSRDTYEKTGTMALWNSNWDQLKYSGTNYRKQSGLVLNIRDSRTKVVWQGVRVAAAGKSPSQIAQGLRKAVVLLLSEFPPHDSTKTK